MKKGKLIAIILVVIILFGGGAFALDYFGVIDIPFLSNDKDNGKVQKPGAAFSVGSGDFYIPADKVFYIGEDDKTYPVQDQQGYQISLVPGQFVAKGNTAYGRYGDNMDLRYKFIFDSKGNVKTQDWVSVETLNAFTDDKAFVANMDNLIINGDYIYFVHTNSGSGAQYVNRIGRVSLDGKNIEYISQAGPADYTILNNKIYYYDWGFSGASGGIYEMNLDGSGATLVYTDALLGTSYDVVEDMMACGDYIYFKAGTGVTSKGIYRVKADGTDFRRISANYALSYTIDEDDNTLYYENYTTGSVGRIYSVKLDSVVEQVVADRDKVHSAIACFDDCLYFSNDLYVLSTESGEDNPSLCGMRYNLEEDKMEALYGYYETPRVVSQDEQGFYKTTNAENPQFYWAEYVG